MVIKKASWGTVNAELGVHAIVTPVEPITDGQAADLRTRVETALAKRVPATVTVDRSLGSSGR